MNLWAFCFLNGSVGEVDNINWFKCPKCGKPLLKITEKSIVKNEIYCRCCKTSFDVDIDGLKINKTEKKQKST
mgnify:CR=1 FL=1